MSSWQRKLEVIETACRAEKHNRALFLLDETLKTHTNIPIYTAKCNILEKLGRVNEAVAVVREMTSTNQRSPEAYLNGGQLCASLKRPIEALGIVNIGIATYHELDQQQLSPEDIRKWVKLYLLKGKLQNIEQQRLSSRRDPMTILQPELISVIVQMAIGDLNTNDLDTRDVADGYGLLERLARVSTLWRHTLHNCTELWSNCYIKLDGSKEDPRKKIEYHYQRAQQSPLRAISIDLVSSESYHYSQDLQRTCDALQSWLNPATKLRSIKIVHKPNSQTLYFQKSLSTIINPNSFDTVDSFEYALDAEWQNRSYPRPLNSNFLLEKVNKEIKLEDVRLFDYDVESPTDLGDDNPNDWLGNQRHWMRPPMRAISPPFDHPLQTLILKHCGTPTFAYLMALFPRLKRFVMCRCNVRTMPLDNQITEIRNSNLETLIIENYTEPLFENGIYHEPISYHFPNLRHCVLKYDLSGLHWSKKLRHLEITGYASQANLCFLRDRLVAAFDGFEELEVLKLCKVDFAQAVLGRIAENQLCAKLRKISVRSILTGDTVDDFIIRLIMQRNFTNEFASIDDVSMVKCSIVKPQSYDIISRHVKVANFDP